MPKSLIARPWSELTVAITRRCPVRWRSSARGSSVATRAERRLPPAAMGFEAQWPLGSLDAAIVHPEMEQAGGPVFGQEEEIAPLQRHAFTGIGPGAVRDAGADCPRDFHR